MFTAAGVMLMAALFLSLTTISGMADDWPTRPASLSGQNPASCTSRPALLPLRHHTPADLFTNGRINPPVLTAPAVMTDCCHGCAPTLMTTRGPCCAAAAAALPAGSIALSPPAPLVLAFHPGADRMNGLARPVEPAPPKSC